MSTVANLTSVSDHDAAVSKSASNNTLLVLIFVAEWHQPCQQMIQVAQVLAKQQPTAAFYLVDAEGVADVTEKYPVESVPTVVFIKKGVVVDKLEGVNPAQFTSLVTKYISANAPVPSPSSTPSTAAAASEESKEDLNARLSKLTHAAPVMIFIKGTPTEPKCGFTKKLLAVLDDKKVVYEYFNILSDSTVREGLKTFSNWPTYPQVYVKGELIGGLDVVKELAENGELLEMIPKESVKCEKQQPQTLEDRLKALINQKPVMLFMKGSPTDPQCGFSARAIELLHGVNCTDFGYFDIFSDNEVREGLKQYSNWPTYPQLYVNGELIGGLDIMTEMKEAGELESALASK